LTQAALKKPVLVEAPVEAPAARPAPASRQHSPVLVTLRDPLSPGAEAIRALRTHILAQHLQAGRRSLAICAPSVGVGCTFVAVNLAVALAQVGIKTLLIDGDLRSPTIQQILPPSGSAGGLGEALASGASIAEFVEPDVLPNLSVLYAGKAVSNAQELLATDAFEDVMHQCLRDHEITIIDTPPANICADARRISTVVGYSLIVARQHKTLVSDVKTLATQLLDDQARVIGTLLNAV
jgi:protein-tyrosine kinase